MRFMIEGRTISLLNRPSHNILLQAVKPHYIYSSAKFQRCIQTIQNLALSPQYRTYTRQTTASGSIQEVKCSNLNILTARKHCFRFLYIIIRTNLFHTSVLNQVLYIILICNIYILFAAFQLQGGNYCHGNCVNIAASCLTLPLYILRTFNMKLLQSSQDNYPYCHSCLHPILLMPNNMSVKSSRTLFSSIFFFIYRPILNYIII